jgi:peroxiredoxin
MSLQLTGEAPDTTAPQISNVVLSDIGSTSLTFSWVTNEAGTSMAEYDVSTYPENYAFSRTDAGLTTAHELVVSTGLAPNTTYYARVCSTDASGNQGCTEEFSFTMGAVEETVVIEEQVVTVTNTVTNTVTTTVTNTVQEVRTVVEKDTTPPRVTLTTELEEIFESAPVIEGEVTDGKGVLSVVYSLDRGVNWLAVDELTGQGQKAADFRIILPTLADGTYGFLVRGIDTSNNIRDSELVEMTIDRLAPQVGPGILLSAGRRLSLNQVRMYELLAGSDLTLVTSVIGGATEVGLVVSLDGEVVMESEMMKDTYSGLWQGKVRVDEPGVYEMKVHALDGAGKEDERVWGNLEVVEKGRVVNEEGEGVGGVQVTVYRFVEELQRFLPWEAQAYGEENPIVTADGVYGVWLPPGQYYLEFKAEGYKTAVSNMVTVETAGWLRPEVRLTRRGEIRLGSWRWRWPDWGVVEVEVPHFASVDTEASRVYHVERGKQSGEMISPSSFKRVGEVMPLFSMQGQEGVVYSSSFRGKKTVVVLGSSWDPVMLSTLKKLETLGEDPQYRVVGILLHESKARAGVVARQGGYEVELLADPDGVVVEALGLTAAPTVLVVDENGAVVSDALVYGLIDWLAD